MVGDERRRVERPGREPLEHRVDVLDHVRVARLQGQRLDPDDAHVDLDPLGVDAGRRDGARLAGQPAGELERVGMADRVDRRVDARGPRSAALTAARGSSSVRWTGVGAERAGQLEPLRDRVDRDHAAPAPSASAACTAQRPTGPRPRTATVAPGSTPALDHRVVAGAHHVAGEQRDVVGHPLGDPAQGEVGVRHQQQLGLGALQRAERRAVAEDPPVVALVEVAAAAEEALAAGGAVGAEHPVADRRPR